MGRNLHWTQQQYDDYVRRHNLPRRNTDSNPIVETPKHKGREPNKTEAQFGLILEAQKRRGDIIHYAYEGISLSWGDGMRYKPDWVVIIEDAPIKLIECKGPYIFPKDLIRFKGCRAQWKEWFDFEMHQKKEGSWIRLF